MEQSIAIRNMTAITRELLGNDDFTVMSTGPDHITYKTGLDANALVLLETWMEDGKAHIRCNTRNWSSGRCHYIYVNF